MAGNWLYDPQAVENVIRQGQGYDPNTAMEVFRREGFQPGVWQSTIGSGANREESYGPFQLNMKPGAMGAQFQKQTGLDPRDPSTVVEQAKWVSQQIPQTGWTPWHAARNAGIGPWQGISGKGGGGGGVSVPPFDPTAPAEPQTTGSVGAQGAPGGGDLKSQWQQFMSNDDNRAALFQLGISLLQPIGVGQSVAGHIGQALGQAGEVYGTREQMRMEQEKADLAQQLAQQKMTLEERQQTAAEEELQAKKPLYGAQTKYYEGTGRQTGGGMGGALTEYQRQRLYVNLGSQYDKLAQNILDPPTMTRDEWIADQLWKNGQLDQFPELAGMAPAAAEDTTPTPGGGTITPDRLAKVKDLNIWLNDQRIKDAIEDYKRLTATPGSSTTAGAEKRKNEILSAAKAVGLDAQLAPYFVKGTPGAP